MKYVKKLAACIFAACVMTALSAQNSLGIGARGTFGLALGTEFSGDAVDDYQIDNVDVFRSFLFGGAVVAKVGFDSFPGLYVQPEIGFTRNQIGYRWGDSDREDYRIDTTDYRTEYRYESSGTIGYNSIDIPVLAGWDLYLTDGLFVSPFIGFNMSFPFDIMTWTYGESSGSAVVYADGVEVERNTFASSEGGEAPSVSAKIAFVPGVLAGFGFGYRFDSSAVSGDFRYNLDLSPVVGERKFRGQAQDFHVLRRRGLTFNLGYMYFF